MFENRNVYVVEGKTDVSFLHNLNFYYFIQTEGTTLKDNVFKLVDEVLKSGRKVVLIADPDNKGQIIRNKFKNKYQKEENVISILLDKNSCFDGNKYGVANSNLNYLSTALNEFVEYEIEQSKLLSYELNKDNLLFLHDRKFRLFLVNKFNFQTTTYKGVLKSLNMIKIEEKRFISLLKEYENEI